MTRPHLLEQACEGPCFPALPEKGRLSPTANSRGPWSRLLECLPGPVSLQDSGDCLGLFLQPSAFH